MEPHIVWVPDFSNSEACFLRSLTCAAWPCPISSNWPMNSEDSVYLCIEDNGEALCLERLDGPSPVKVTVLQRGGRLPLYAGAGPLALLSGMDDEKIFRIMKGIEFNHLTEHTIQNIHQLMDAVQQIRKQGYSVSWEDVTIGVGSFGAPVNDSSGTVIGAISIGGLLIRYDGRRKHHYIDLVKDTAMKISKGLGFTPRNAAP